MCDPATRAARLVRLHWTNDPANPPSSVPEEWNVQLRRGCAGHAGVVKGISMRRNMGRKSGSPEHSGYSRSVRYRRWNASSRLLTCEAFIVRSDFEPRVVGGGN